MARSACVASRRFAAHGVAVALVVGVALAGCGRPDGTETGASGARVASPGASPVLLRPGPGTIAPVPATPTATVTRPAVANPALLAQLGGARTLAIDDGWWVYGPIQEFATSFVLGRDGAGFAGTGSYSAKSYYGPASATTRAIAIPAAAFAAFIEKLADAPLREGAYKPSIPVTDYYPKLRIALETPGGTVTFHSESQGETHVPWGVTFGGRSYVIDTPQPMEALTSLEPYLRRDETFKSLKTTIEATVTARPTATAVTPPQCRPVASGQRVATPVTPPSADMGAARVAPGAQVHTGEVINLAQYYGLASSTFVSAGGNFKPFSITDRQVIAALVAALDREGVVVARPGGYSPEDFIMITFDVDRKPVSLTYYVEQGLIIFSGGEKAYATPAPPEFPDLWRQLICTRAQ